MTKFPNSAVMPKAEGVSVGASTSIVDVPIDKIVVEDGRRNLHLETVANLSQSIAVNGLQTPIQVARIMGGSFSLVAGLHRLEAIKALGWKSVPCTLVPCGSSHILEITENLIRAELTALERFLQLVEWTRVVKKETSTRSGNSLKRGARKNPEVQAALKSPAFGATVSARYKMYERAKKVARLTDDVIDALKAAKLDDSPFKISKVASCSSRDEQLRMIAEIVKQRSGNVKKRNASAKVRRHSSSSQDNLLDPDVEDGILKLEAAWHDSEFKRAWQKAVPWDRHEFAKKHLKTSPIDNLPASSIGRLDMPLMDRVYMESPGMLRRKVIRQPTQLEKLGRRRSLRRVAKKGW